MRQHYFALYRAKFEGKQAPRQIIMDKEKIEICHDFTNLSARLASRRFGAFDPALTEQNTCRRADSIDDRQRLWICI